MTFWLQTALGTCQAYETFFKKNIKVDYQEMDSNDPKCNTLKPEI